MKKIGLYFILATLLPCTGFQQQPSPITVFSKNQVHGVFLSAKAFKAANNLVKLTVTINNTDDDALYKMAYELKLIGSNSKILLDTVINLPEIDNKQEEVPEFVNIQLENDGEMVRILNPAYSAYLDEKLKNQFRIKSKSKHASTVSFTKKNVTAIKIKPIWADFGGHGYFAPGY